MNFPLRLALDLWRGHLFRAGDNGKSTAPIFHLPAAWLPALHENGFDQSADGDSHTAAGSVRTAAKTNAPALWISGSRPFDHRQGGHVGIASNPSGLKAIIH